MLPRWTPQWVRDHAFLSAAVSTVVAMISLFVVFQEVWAGFSSEPMVPMVYRWSEQYLPTIGRGFAIAVWGIVSLGLGLLVVGIYRSSRTILQSPTTHTSSQADAPRIAVPQLSLTKPFYELNISGQRNFEGLGLPDGNHVARVSILADATGPMLMEQFRLRIAGEELPALRANTLEAGGETMLMSWVFDVPNSIPLGHHPATFLVFGAGEWWTSDPFNMDLRWD